MTKFNYFSESGEGGNKLNPGGGEAIERTQNMANLLEIWKREREKHQQIGLNKQRMIRIKHERVVGSEPISQTFNAIPLGERELVGQCKH